MINFAQIANWTRKELFSIQHNSQRPICVELANGDYLVGKHKVEKMPNGWKVQDIIFSFKQSAIYYCSLIHLGYLNKAAIIVAVDSKVATLDTNKNIFRERLDQAHTQHDLFKIGLFTSKYSETKNQLISAKIELANMFNYAKWITDEHEVIK